MVDDELPNGERMYLFPKCHVESQASSKHPERNEDAFCAGKDFIGVFDALGGQPGSEAASRIAAEYCDQELKNMPTELSPAAAMRYIDSMLRNASLAIANYAEQRYEEGTDIGIISTTAAISKLCTDPESGAPYVVSGVCGDSRVDIVEDDEIIFSTLDHSGAQYIGGRLLPEDTARKIQDRLDELTTEPDPDERIDGEPVFLHYQTRNLIGACLTSELDEDEIDALRIRTSVRAVKPGTIIIASTDGLHDNLTKQERLDIIRTTRNPRDIPDKLIVAAEKRSYDTNHGRSKMDDMTCGVLIV